MSKKKTENKLYPLETLKGSKIWYSSKFGVGKEIGGKVYAHMDYIEEIVPPDVLEKARKLFKEQVGDVKCNTFSWNRKKPHFVRFDECPNFLTEREPAPNRIWYIDTEEELVTKGGIVQQIFHHKWLWVKEDFTGFDVKKSHKWSEKWLSKLEEPASGYAHIWEEQLAAVGLK